MQNRGWVAYLKSYLKQLPNRSESFKSLSTGAEKYIRTSVLPLYYNSFLQRETLRHCTNHSGDHSEIWSQTFPEEHWTRVSMKRKSQASRGAGTTLKLGGGGGQTSPGVLGNPYPKIKKILGFGPLFWERPSWHVETNKNNNERHWQFNVGGAAPTASKLWRQVAPITSPAPASLQAPTLDKGSHFYDAAPKNRGFIAVEWPSNMRPTSILSCHRASALHRPYESFNMEDLQYFMEDYIFHINVSFMHTTTLIGTLSISNAHSICPLHRKCNDIKAIDLIDIVTLRYKYRVIVNECYKNK